MPIQHLKNKNSQSWRTSKKKYYVRRNNKPGAVLNLKKSEKSSKRKNKNFDFSNIIPQNLKKKIIITLSLIFAAGVIFAGIMVFSFTKQLPNPNQLMTKKTPQTTKIYDRTGEELLYEIHGDEQRTLVKLEEIPDYVKNATIAIEDKTFYEHGGISVWGILRGVVWRKIRGLSVQGGSTLTQQLVKNAILTNERSIKRKIKEWILAYRLEKAYSKDEILQLYFNEIPYGSTAYGVEAASQRYFAKSVRDINLAEAAILAALPQAPSLYSPYGSNVDRLIIRQEYILDLMAEQEYITEEQAKEAKEYELEFKKPTIDMKAPHFVMLVKEILAEKYGEKTIEQDGYKIITTLDLYKQKIAEDIINEKTESYEEDYNASNAALLSIDPKTGQVLSMVGSRDYFNDEIDGQVNITTSKRQPGSSMKPLVYGTTFIKGYTPNTILYDVLTNFSVVDEDDYVPHNYNNKELGPVSIRKALQGSLNIPAVKAIYLAGVNNVLDLAEELGYTTFGDRDRYGLSLVLGGGEVKMLEHVNAYGAFAREGILHPVSLLLKVEDSDGNILEEFKESDGRKVMDPKIARQINNILSDNKARAYAFGEINNLNLGERPVAAKTGTTNDYRDAWTIGYTPSLVTGVWVGNNDNSEMNPGAGGSTLAAPIWHEFMKQILGDTPIEKFKEPEIPETGIDILDGKIDMGKIVKIDKASGLLATEFTPEELIEEKVFADPHCILHYINKNDPLGDAPKNPEKDSQYELWEKAVLEWFEEEKNNASSTFATSTELFEMPTEFDNLHLPENKPIINIISPEQNENILDPLFIVKIKPTAPRGIDTVEYYINDNLLYSTSNYPFNLEKKIDFLPNGFHNLKIKVCDDVNNCTTEQIEFNLILEENEDKKDIKLSIDAPSNGIAVSNIDFPLNIRINSSDPYQISKLNVYTKNENNESLLIGTIEPINNFFTTYKWDETPFSGTYKIFAEAITWGGDTIRSKDNTIIVTNIEKTEEKLETDDKNSILDVASDVKEKIKEKVDNLLDN